MEKYLNKKEIINIEKKAKHQVPDEDKKELERCVLCGKRINVRRDTCVDFRAYYVEGCGQICKECFVSLYVECGSRDRSREISKR
jgi:hypothetical protein